MNYPYGLMADLHAHDWSSFKTLDSLGRNQRLMDTVNEINRCCSAVLDCGGNFVYFAGDIFHIRGSVPPSVFNVVKECITYWQRKGIYFRAIPGNHDLESNVSTALTSAVHMLESNQFHCWAQPTIIHNEVVLIPWINGAKGFLDTVEKIAKSMLSSSPSCYDMICHIGIDGTLSNVAAHGVTVEKLEAFGFRRVFSGHYHHHKAFSDKVYSIGAPTHQTWSDAGTKAGWMLIFEDRVQWCSTHAPKFIDIDGTQDEEDLELIVDGNFVRAKIGAASAKDMREWNQKLRDMHAKGVLLHHIPESAVSKRTGVAAKSISSIRKSVTDYCAEKSLAPEVTKLCEDVLGEVGL